MNIAQLLDQRSTAVVTCPVETSVREAVHILSERRIGAMPVLRDGEVAGIFSERDVIYQLHGQGSGVLDRPVGEVMTAPAVTITPQNQVLEALALMTRRRIRHLPVMDGGRMIGFISIGDLVKFRIEMIEREAEAMRAYIQTA